ETISHFNGPDPSMTEAQASPISLIPNTLSLDKFRQLVVIKAGEIIRIDAEITGRPIPVVSWSKDGKDIDTKARCEITSTNFTTTLIVRDVIRRDSGQYVLTLHNVAGTRSVAINCKVLDRPGPASGPLAVSGLTAEKCTITWGPPQENGGAEIMHYIVEKRETSRLAWTLVYGDMKATTCKVTKLLKGNEYIFRVRGVNKYGDGEALESEAVKALDPFTVAAAPTNVQVTSVTSGAMTICWERPVSDGGSSICGYVIEKREKTGLRWCRVNKKPVYDLRVKASNLREGSEYEYRVFAENAAGLSAPSTPCPLTKAEDPQFLPSPPAKPRIIDSTKTTVTLAWNKPLFDGGAPVTGYRVEYRKSLDDEWFVGVQNTKNMEFTVVGLTPGAEYVFVVRSINKIGASEPKFILFNSAIIIIFFFCLTEEADLDLDVPMTTQYTAKAGRDVEVFIPLKGRPAPNVTWRRGDRNMAGDNRYTINSTERSTTLRIPKVTRDDCGKYVLEIENGVGEPKIITVSLRNVTRGKLTLSWEAPLVDGGSPVTNYIVEKKASTMKAYQVISAECPNTSYKVTGLEEDVAYFFRVSAENEFGVGDFCESTEAVRATETPGAVKNLVMLDSTKTSVTLQWTRPDHDGGSHITEYIVEKRSQDEVNWSLGATCKRCTCEVTGLRENAIMDFRVFAKNEKGRSDFSQIGPIPVIDFIIPPEANVVDTTSSTASLVWLKPDHDGGSRIRGYIVEFRAKGSDRWIVYGETKLSKMLVEGLIENSEYDFRVKAKNDAGVSEPQGTFSSVVIKEPLIEPTADLSSITNQLITVKLSNTITIDIPISGRPAPKVTWKLEEMKLKETDRVLIRTTKERTTLIVRDSKRSDSGKYYLILENAAGVMTFTVTVVVVGRPSPPTGPVKISGISSESCTLSWSEPADDGGTEITNYIVEKRESGHASWQVVNSSVQRTTIKVTHLTKYMEYTFRVCAENKFGVSKSIESAAVVIEHPFSRFCFSKTISHILALFGS
uniref:Titin n=1 Tax=Poecilia reticulata TaxID=8081 RepID=A0A3P9Q123_POERE